jgi:hypothetical protein
MGGVYHASLGILQARFAPPKSPGHPLGLICITIQLEVSYDERRNSGKDGVDFFQGHTFEGPESAPVNINYLSTL